MKRIHSAFSTTTLEIKGQFYMQGPQAIGTDGGAPQWIADYFVANPKIETIALSGKSKGVVYGRME